MIAAAGAAEPLLAAGGPSYDGIGKWMAVLALYDMTFIASASPSTTSCSRTDPGTR